MDRKVGKNKKLAVRSFSRALVCPKLSVRLWGMSVGLSTAHATASSLYVSHRTSRYMSEPPAPDSKASPRHWITTGNHVRVLKKKIHVSVRLCPATQLSAGPSGGSRSLGSTLPATKFSSVRTWLKKVGTPFLALSKSHLR